MQRKYFKYDLYRYFYPDDSVSKRGFLSKIKILVAEKAIWAIFVYRVRRWLFYECKNKLVVKLLKPVFFVAKILTEITTGILIDPHIDIGPGLYIGHFGQIFMGGHTKVGKCFNISQGCTLGFAGRGDKLGLPEIGDFVYIAPGAKVIGKIKIGNNVAIGSNAVVTKDIPDNAVAVGIPAKVINYNSSSDFVVYNKEKMRDIL